MIKEHLVKRIFSCAIGWILFVAPLIGQTIPTPTPNPNQDLQDQKDRLGLQKDIEDLKTQIGQDQINRAKANIGTINTANLPTGQAQLSNVDIQPSIIGFAAMRTVVNQVIKDLYDDPLKCPDSVVFRSATLDDIALLATYKKLLSDASDQLNPYEKKPAELKLGSAVASFAPALAFAAIDAAVSLGALFKSDVTMNGVTMTPDDEALRYHFASSLRSKCPNATIIDPNSFSGPLADDSKLLKLIKRINGQANNLQGQVMEVQIIDLPRYEKQIADAQKALKEPDEYSPKIKRLEEELKRARPGEQPKIQEQIKALKAQQEKAQNDLKDRLQLAQANQVRGKEYVAEATALAARVTALNTALNKIDDSGTPFLLKLLKAEALDGKVNQTPVLLLGFVKIGGTSVVKKNAFHTSIKYGGGALVKFELRDLDGLKVIKSGEEDAYQYHSESDSLGSNK